MIVGCQKPDAVQDTVKGVAETVNHNHIIVGLEQFQCCLTANVPQTTGDKYVLTEGCDAENFRGCQINQRVPWLVCQR